MMATPTSDKAAAVRAITDELKVDQAEREAIQAEATEGEPKPVPPPQGVWEGTLRELLDRPIERPQPITDLGSVPVVEGAKVVLYGQPSSTKTLLAFRAAIDVALQGGDVWLLEGEGHEWYFRSRLDRIARGFLAQDLEDRGVRRDEDVLELVQDHIRISHKPFVLEEGQDYWTSRLATWRPKLVLLDPLIDYTAANENDAKEMRAYLRLVQIATDQYGCAAIVCHHSTKPSESGRSRERGSGSIKGWADVQISVAVDPEQRRPGRVVARAKCEKGRDLNVEPGETELRWSFWDDRIELETGAVMKETETQQDAKAAAEQRRATIVARHRKKLVALLSDGPMTRQEIKDRTGWGGTQLKDILQPLFDEERVHGADALRRNARGHERVVKVVKLGPAPPISEPGSEPGSSETGSKPETEATDGND